MYFANADFRKKKAFSAISGIQRGKIDMRASEEWWPNLPVRVIFVSFIFDHSSFFLFYARKDLEGGWARTTWDWKKRLGIHTKKKSLKGTVTRKLGGSPQKWDILEMIL